jgi:NTP pyrophosphatase (non-canonical NTP hydrolase)
MKMNEYQSRAVLTDQHPGAARGAGAALLTKGEVIPLLGMAGEIGTLLSEYKKVLRDGPRHVKFREQVAEELGDVLWYIANVASKFDLRLEDIAKSNLTKTRDRWASDGVYQLLDSRFPRAERLPRKFEYTFGYVTDHGRTKVVLRDKRGKQVGDPLTDNARMDDGYRFHDVFHLANAAILGWSPVTRGLIDRKRRSDKVYDEVEDGGRAAVIEEGIVASIYEYASRHQFLEGSKAVDWEVLRSVKRLAASVDLEVRTRSAGDWERAILVGYEVWRKVCDHDGGTIRGDLHKRAFEFVKGRRRTTRAPRAGRSGRGHRKS